MNAEDRAAIEGLFGRLSEVEKNAPTPDADAEAFIRDRVASQPASPYFMAQTIVVQEQALGHTQARIDALEAELAQQSQSSGGLFGGLFGGGAPARPAQGMMRPPAQAAAQAPMQPQRGVPSTRGAQAGPMGAQQGAQGGGFLAGAAQTAMGVAGGILVANAIGGMLDGGDAQAAEAPVEDPMAEEPPMDDMGDGGVFDMFGGGDSDDF